MVKHEHELETRESIINHFLRSLNVRLTKANPAFRFIRIESPIVVNAKRKTNDPPLKLRTNTVSGALEACNDVLNGKGGVKQKLPLVIWQHGKVFGKRETYALEFHVLYSASTAADYYSILVTACESMLKKQCGPIRRKSENGAVTFIGCTGVLLTIRPGKEFETAKSIEIQIDMDLCTTASLEYEPS